MISFLRGVIASKNENGVVIDVGGVGFGVSMPTSDIAKTGMSGDEITVHTYFNMTEAGVQLFGFLTTDQLEYFHKLIAISGIGPKAALAVLGTLSVQDLAYAIIAEDVKAITRAPGVGPKAAQRIILELKDKLKNEDMVESKEYKLEVKVSNNQADEAISALQVLGYPCKDATKAVAAVDTDGLSVEEIIKAALKLLI